MNGLKRCDMYIYRYIYIHVHTHTHTYTTDYYSAMREEQNNAMNSHMDTTRDYHTKIIRKRKTNTV